MAVTTTGISLVDDNKNAKDAPRLSLLYGDNGKGKTTILELIFHLISPAVTRGHRSHVARIPFKQFSIFFSDRSQLTASRRSDDLVGDYSLTLVSAHGTTDSAEVTIDRETQNIRVKQLTPEIKKILDQIADWNLDVLYLDDSRDLKGDTITSQFARLSDQEALAHFGYDELDIRLRELEQSESTLVKSISRTEQWLNIEAIRASSVGETDARQSYVEILRTIATAGSPADSDISEEQVARLQQKLSELELISSEFASLGLGSAIDAASLAEIFDSASETTLPVVAQVLGSFLDGQQARLNALKAIYDKIHSFVAITNKYLTDKKIAYDVYSGFTIQLPDQELDPDRLSSGEKHLLLLFFNIFASSDRAPLFIIDEPELSLNVKWQRGLVDSLLELSKDSRCQFLMATHSIELLAKHREYVVGLR